MPVGHRRNEDEPEVGDFFTDLFLQNEHLRFGMILLQAGDKGHKGLCVKILSVLEKGDTKIEGNLLR